MHASMSLNLVANAWFQHGNTSTALTHELLVSSPDPTLAEGKASGEFGLNPWFSLYGMRRQGHAKLGSNWSL